MSHAHRTYDARQGEIDRLAAENKALTAELARLREKVRELQHLERTAISWLDAEDAYASQQGEDIPYSAEYAKIVEARIFNNQAIRRTIKARAALNKEG